MPKYSVLIQYDSRDDIYVASIPELPGCIAHGKTQYEAIQELQIAYELWMEAAQEIGAEVPSPMLHISQSV